MTYVMHLARGLGRVFAPSSVGVLIAFIISLTVLVVSQTQAILTALHITPAALDQTRGELYNRFGQFLSSSITSNLALVTFWATIGLIVYLICWGGYNLLIDARNEVTLETQYTNQAGRGGVWLHGVIKALSIAALVAYLSVFAVGFSLWLALSEPVVASISAASITLAIVAVTGFALQIYLLFALIKLTFTPWYAQDPFTD